jgi:hypothetical protein
MKPPSRSVPRLARALDRIPSICPIYSRRCSPSALRPNLDEIRRYCRVVAKGDFVSRDTRSVFILLRNRAVPNRQEGRLARTRMRENRVTWLPPPFPLPPPLFVVTEKLPVHLTCSRAWTRTSLLSL